MADTDARVRTLAVRAAATELAALSTRPWTMMEVCGGQTHAIVRWGLDQLLPPGLRLIHGPGCPVCVTPAGTVEQALELARRPEVILCSYGDMLRVPGEGRDSLLAVRAAGADVRLLTAPLQALELARSQPQRQVVFLAVGFETTAPATALLARQALALGVENLSLLCAHVRVSPAMEAILADPANQVQGFLAAGHVCSVIGTGELEALTARWQVPVVVTGFEPLDLMRGVLACVRQLEAGIARVENAYAAVVRPEGNRQARRLLEEVFEACDRPWRGLGLMPGGGLALRGPYRMLEAGRRFAAAPRRDGEASGGGGAGGRSTSAPMGIPTRAVARPSGPAPRQSSAEVCGEPACPVPQRALRAAPACCEPGPAGAEHAQPAQQTPAPEAPWQAEPPRAAGAGSPSEDDVCIAGAVLRGVASPLDCPSFGRACTPEHPLGAPMVSSEGACAAYVLYRPPPSAHRDAP